MTSGVEEAHRHFGKTNYFQLQGWSLAQTSSKHYTEALRYINHAKSNTNQLFLVVLLSIRNISEIQGM
jgi:hypothetical protein